MSDSLENSGYRLTKEKKETLRAIGVPLRLYSLQAVIKCAVDEFLQRYGSKDVNTGLNPDNLGVSLTPHIPSADRLMAVEMAVQEVLVALAALRQPGEPAKDGALGDPTPSERPGADRPGRKRFGGR